MSNKKLLFDLCSPSWTGMGLEILRSAQIYKYFNDQSCKLRVWTFHPLAFDDSKVEVIPLQQGWRPMLPEATADDWGAVWLPHNHPQGPYVCQESLGEAKKRNFVKLESPLFEEAELGAYPNWIMGIATTLFCNQKKNDHSHPFYPPDLVASPTSEILVNLIGASGDKKGLSNSAVVADVAMKLSYQFPELNFIFLLHANVCSGQIIPRTNRNIKWLTHLYSDSRVARLLHPDTLIFTVEGGLAHAAIYRGCRTIVIGLSDWLEETNYLYPSDNSFKQHFVKSFSEKDLVEAISFEINQML